MVSKTRAEVEMCLLELQGLSQILHIYEVTGRAGELLASAGKETNIGELIIESLRITDRIGASLAAELERPEIAALVEIGSTLELLILMLTMFIQAHGTAGAQHAPQASSLCNKCAAHLEDWLDPAVGTLARTFLSDTPGIFEKDLQASRIPSFLG
jgi:hypothetical protein